MLITFLSIFIISLLLTALIRYYAISRKVLDIPNQRSSHTIPTARGGGLAIVIAFYLANIFLFVTDQLDIHWFYALSATLLVAAIGFCDDHAHVPVRWRFLVHAISALLVLYFLNGWPELLLPSPFSEIFGTTSLHAGWLGIIPGLLLLVWFLNLFNFMDGTDGIAGSEALFVCLSLAFYFFDSNPMLFKLNIYLAAAVSGFVVWNWPKAKIFMGDVGSGYLGLLIGVLILIATQQQSIMLYCGLIVFGLFIVDASYTLFIRFKTGQKWYAAHCSHTYQRAAKLHGHLRILQACWLINLGWLFPVSLSVYHYPRYALFGLIIAYLPLFWLAYRFKAGQIEANS